MFTVKRVVAGVGAVFALGVAPLATAAIDPISAIADGTLKFTNFAFTTGGSALCSQDPGLNDGVCRTDGTTPILYILNGNETADSATSLNGVSNPLVSTSNPLGASFVAASGLGPNYTAPTVANPTLFTELGSVNGTPNTTTGAVTDLYSGGTSFSSGNSLTGSADVLIQSQVSLNGPGQTGSAQVNQNLSTEFLLQNLSAPLTIDLDFTATRFWRGALGQDGILAKGSTSFTITIDVVEDSNGIFLPGGAVIGENILTFSPTLNLPLGLGGSCAFVTDTCTSIIPFALTGSREAPNAGGDTFDGVAGNLSGNKVATGNFNISIDLPELANANWYYKFTITGGAVADAETPRALVPAPGVLALLGLGLLGLGIARRRAS
jgi:hypothetical protein